MDKDVLDLTEEELRKLDVKTLKTLESECDLNEQRYSVQQLVKKILINSLYGAIGNTAFPLYNMFIAAAITSNGRFFIQKTSDYIERYLQKGLPSDKPYITYNDTDSVTGDTLVYLDGEALPISEVFNLGEPVQDGEMQVRRIDGCTKAYSDHVEDRPITYVMKHKVKKRLFKVQVGDKSVTVTEDHSLVVRRSGRVIEVKPAEVLDTDEFILLE